MNIDAESPPYNAAFPAGIGRPYFHPHGILTVSIQYFRVENMSK
jgi:hypothetical protein